MKNITFCISLLIALLPPAMSAAAGTAPASKPVPPLAPPAKPPAAALAPAAAAVPDTVNYEKMILPESEQEYWSLDYYQSDNDQEGSDWKDNRRQRDDQGADTRGSSESQSE